MPDDSDWIPLMDAIRSVADDPKDRMETNAMQTRAADNFKKRYKPQLKQIGGVWFVYIGKEPYSFKVNGFYQWASIAWPKKEKCNKLKIYKSVENSVKTTFRLGLPGIDLNNAEAEIGRLLDEIDRLKSEIEELKPDAEKHRNRVKNISIGLNKKYQK